MKHIMGNSPKCYECKHWKKKEASEKSRKEGWCYNKKANSIGINGHKREHVPERLPTNQGDSCSWWEDAEWPHINHFEANCHIPDPNRNPVEALVIADAIAKAKEEQQDLTAYYEHKRWSHA